MTKKTKRVHRQALPANLAAALLNVPFADARESQPDNYSSIGRRLEAAKEELASAVGAANSVLAKNPLTGIIAEHAARQAGKRGTPTVSVDALGDVMLEVYYTSTKGAAPAPPPPRKVKLPLMGDLRLEATRLGIDWVPYGKAKKKLIAAIAAVRKGATPESLVVRRKKPKPEKPKPEIKKIGKPTPLPQVKPISHTPIPLNDDGDDVADLFRQLDGGPKRPKLPPKPRPVPTEAEAPIKLRPKPRPTPARPMKSAVPPPKRSGRSLSAIALGANSEVDIEAILAAPAPQIPQED